MLTRKQIVGLAFIPIALVSVALLAFAIRDAAEAQPTFLGPNVYAVTVGASATLGAVPQNPSRRALTICNGHATQSVTFTFGTAITPVSVTTGLVLPGGNVASSCYTTPGSITSGIGAQINMIALGASTPVTVFEY